MDGRNYDEKWKGMKQVPLGLVVADLWNGFAEFYREGGGKFADGIVGLFSYTVKKCAMFVIQLSRPCRANH